MRACTVRCAVPLSGEGEPIVHECSLAEKLSNNEEKSCLCYLFLIMLLLTKGALLVGRVKSSRKSFSLQSIVFCRQRQRDFKRTTLLQPDGKCSYHLVCPNAPLTAGIDTFISEACLLSITWRSVDGFKVLFS